MGTKRSHATFLLERLSIQDLNYCILSRQASTLREQARDESGNTASELEDAKWLAPVNSAGVAADRIDANGDPLPGAFAVNFLTITNTHPTQAVTVHFRYFNDECEDLLDFLVLLTCNDTLIFDPLNFEVPDQSGVNTRFRLLGPEQGLFTPISAKAWASGRFLICATASGASLDADDNAELRHSYEARGEVSSSHHCGSLRTLEYFGTKDPFDSNNLIHPGNLHVFNASAVAFNYLIGSQTYAQLVSAEGAAPISQAYGLNAWTRPAVDLWADQLSEDSAMENMYSGLGLAKLPGSPNLRDAWGHPDGDGSPLLAADDFRILSGGEAVTASDGGSMEGNRLALRNDVHGGDTARRGVPDLNPTTLFPDFNVWWGALGTPSIFGIDTDDQVINLLSIMDDYNGSGNAFGSFDDSYSIGPAETTYVLQIFNHEEDLYDFVVNDPKPNISPPITDLPDPAVLKIVVDCLRIWMGETKAPQASVEDMSISDLQLLTLAVGGPLAHLADNVPPEDLTDLSAGWIRFVRDNTRGGTWQAWSVDPDWDADSQPNTIGTFVTTGFQSIVQGGLGAAWWLSSVAHDPWVSSTGHQSCNENCLNGASRDASAAAAGTPW